MIPTSRTRSPRCGFVVVVRSTDALYDAKQDHTRHAHPEITIPPRRAPRPLVVHRPRRPQSLPPTSTRS
jgi:hypothetical protein